MWKSEACLKKFTGWVTSDKAITFKDAKALTTTFTGLAVGDSASGVFAFIGLSMLLLGALVISRKVTNQ